MVLRIFDSEGNRLVEDTKLLQSRQAAFIEITGLDVLAGRASLRAEIWGAAVPSGDKSCQMATSLSSTTVPAAARSQRLAVPTPPSSEDSNDRRV